MDLYEWLLFLHVLAAFLLIAGLVAYGALVLGSGGEAVLRVLERPALALWSIGAVGVLVFGIALALDVDGYELWDGWIIAAIVLWLIGGRAGDLLGRSLRGGAAAVDAGRARAAYAVMALASVLLLIDMIYKPGA